MCRYQRVSDSLVEKIRLHCIKAFAEQVPWHRIFSFLKMTTIYKFVGSLLLLLSLLLACSDPFHYSPFEANVRSSLVNLTEKNLARISQFDTTSGEPFKVALISDPHYHFNDLRDAVNDINGRNEFSFVIVTGDITENGLLKEFEIFHGIMGHLKIPYLTVIGNHDHLSNGASVYRQMFGPLNYSFAFSNVKFIAWDNTIWESENEADFDWLSNALAANPEEERPASQYHHIIPLSHIPPFDGQMIEKGEQFHGLLKAHNVTLSVHGHKHEFFQGDLYGDGIQYMTVGSPQNRNYAALHITPSEISATKIVY